MRRRVPQRCRLTRAILPAPRGFVVRVVAILPQPVLRVSAAPGDGVFCGRCVGCCVVCSFVHAQATDFISLGSFCVCMLRCCGAAVWLSQAALTPQPPLARSYRGCGRVNSRPCCCWCRLRLWLEPSASSHPRYVHDACMPGHGAGVLSGDEELSLMNAMFMVCCGSPWLGCCVFEPQQETWENPQLGVLLVFLFTLSNLIGRQMRCSTEGRAFVFRPGVRVRVGCVVRVS